MQRAPEGARRKKLGHVIAESDQGAAGPGPDSPDRGSRYRPDPGDNGYSDGAPEHETAQSLAGLTCNTEVGIVHIRRGYRDSTGRCEGSELFLGAGLGFREAPAPRSTILVDAGLADCAQ
jgi:hypothetical protein